MKLVCLTFLMVDSLPFARHQNDAFRPISMFSVAPLIKNISVGLHHNRSEPPALVPRPSIAFFTKQQMMWLDSAISWSKMFYHLTPIVSRRVKKFSVPHHSHCNKKLISRGLGHGCALFAVCYGFMVI